MIEIYSVHLNMKITIPLDELVSIFSTYPDNPAKAQDDMVRLIKEVAMDTAVNHAKSIMKTQN